MIAKTLLDYLDSVLDVPVVMEAPEQTSDYVLIDQTGSSRTNHIITTTFAIQSYGDTLHEAMVLNDAVKDAMVGFAELGNVTRVELQTDYNYTNTATKQYRWHAVYLITHY